MEQNYYVECIEKIKTFIEEGELKEAEHLLKEELSMPYIPSFAEKQFVELERQLHGLMSKQSFSGVLPSEIETSLLSEDPQVQLMADIVLRGAKNTADVVEGARTVAACAAAIESAHTEKPVKVRSDF